MLQYVLLATLSIMILPIFAAESMTLNVNTYTEFTEGEKPIIFGSTTGSEGKPLSDVQIQVGFPSRIVLTNTDSTGEFTVESPLAAEPGQYSIIVSATKNTLFADTKISYTVIEKPQTILQNTPTPQENKTNNESEQIDRLALQSETLEEQEQQLQEKLELTEQQKLIIAQREKAQQEMQDQLERLEEKHKSNSPRNAFLGFLSHIDKSVKELFWQQFLFTENITNEAKDAKQQALDSGKSTLEGNTIFQKKAAVSKTELIEYNKKISIEFGNATSTIQEQFNEYGKIPRD